MGAYTGRQYASGTAQAVLDQRRDVALQRAREADARDRSVAANWKPTMKWPRPKATAPP